MPDCSPPLAASVRLRLAFLAAVATSWSLQGALAVKQDLRLGRTIPGTNAEEAGVAVILRDQEEEDSVEDASTAVAAVSEDENIATQALAAVRSELTPAFHGTYCRGLDCQYRPDPPEPAAEGEGRGREQLLSWFYPGRSIPDVT